jgi:predicted nucleic acid-binding protein
MTPEDNPVAVVGDTGALLAFYFADEPDHAACRKALKSVGHLVVSPLVLAELDYLASTGVSPKAAMEVLEDILDRQATGRFEVPEVGQHLAAARVVMKRHAALNIGLTDAVNVALAAEFRTDVIFAVDRRHFRAIRPLTDHAAFRLLPDDL